MSVSIKDNKETSIINIVIEKKDYENKVSSILNDYRKRANIPGFRKGFVPMGMIKKQYEIPVKVDEINKVVQKKLSEFIDENKISLLGTPIPIENEKIDYFLTHYLFGVNDNELEMKGFVSWYDVIVNDIKIGSIYIKKK